MTKFYGLLQSPGVSVIVFYCHIGDDSPHIPVTIHYKVISLECVEIDYITCILSSVDSFTWLKESDELMNYLAFYFCEIIIHFSLVS